MKSITIFGNVVKQPESRTTQKGDKVTSFSLAVNDGFGDNKRTLWFDCSVWGKRGEAIANNVNKGDKLCVTGDLSTREYNDKTYLTVNVNDFSFAGSGGGAGGNGNHAGSQSEDKGHQAPPDDDIDSIPF